MEIIKVEDLSFSYPKEEKKALDYVNLSLREGDFYVLFGKSGSGKSTLLRHLKKELTPVGTKTGQVYINGNNIDEIDNKEATSLVGYVMQSPEGQAVTDKVWHELAFGLESLGFKQAAIRARVAEMAAFFGIEDWFYKNVNELSGGQKQILNLASVMILNPKILVLDEPTSQLDPICASDFFSMLKKINKELGTTIVLCEHRLEEVLQYASKVGFIEDGKLESFDSVSKALDYLKATKSGLIDSFPSYMRVWAKCESSESCPLSVSAGRDFLKRCKANQKDEFKALHEEKKFDETVLELKDVWFRYEENENYVLKGVNLSLYKGEILSILGGNGVGKSTLLKAITGIKAVKGDIIRKGTVSLLSQNPELMFVKKTLLEDLKSMRGAGEDNESFEKRLKNVIGLCKLEDLLSRHPFDLSGGEKQRAALSKVLLLNPDILLLDEPTKGLDAEFKKEFKAILKALTDAGISIIMVSHDLEFSASVSDNAAMFFDGNVISKGNVYDFFSQNNFYTTQANRISKEIYDECITVDDIIYAMGVYKNEDKGDTKQIYYEKIDIEDKGDRNPLYKLPLWRKILGILSLLATICIFIYTMRLGNLADMITKDGITMKGFSHMAIYSLMIVLLFASVLLLTKSTEKKPDTHKKEKLSKRTKAAVLIILLLIPLTLFIWAAYFDKHSFYPVAFLIMIESMAPFFLIFERRKPKARELVLIAALCAITIASRAVFFMLPQFKPVMAMTIICAVAFGGETGFLVGAVSMLVSNIMFSQGPWTPWQMFSMGIIGFLAGILYKANLLRRNKLSLALFGAVSAIVIYGGIMNPVTALIWGGSVLNTKMLMAHYLSGFPMDCVHAAATFIFLWVISEPMLEKLDRIKQKYGLIE